MFLLVPAHLGCTGQNPSSCKMVVCVILSYVADSYISMHFVTHNSKRDLESHLMSFVFIPFDRPYMELLDASIFAVYLFFKISFIKID